MAATKVLGLTPAQRVKMRWKWKGERPTACGGLVQRRVVAPALGQPVQRLVHALIVARLLLQAVEGGGGCDIEGHDRLI